HQTFSRVVIKTAHPPFYDLKDEKSQHRIIIQLYQTVIGQSQLRSLKSIPMIQEVLVREIGKRHSQIIIRIDTERYTYKCYTLFRPYRLVVDVYPQAAQQKAESYESIFQAGLKFYQQKDFDQALAKFKVAAINGRMTKAYYYAGIIRFRQKKYPEAVYNFSYALKEEKQFADSYIYLSTISQDRNDYPKAVEYLDQFLKVSPDTSRFAEIRRQRAYCQDVIDRIVKLEDLKAKNDSLRALRKPQIDSAEVDSFLTTHAIKQGIGEEEPRQWMTYANEHYERQDYDKAVKTLHALIKIYPNTIFYDDAHLLLAKIYYELHLFPQARDYATVLLSRNPDTEFLDQILFIVGESQYQLKNYPEAREHLKQFVQRFPNHAESYRAHLYLARIYEIERKTVLRDEAYNLALTLVKDRGDRFMILRELADLFQQKGETRKSLGYINAILHLFEQDKNPELLRDRQVEYAILTAGDLHFQLNEMQPAENAYQKALQYYLRESPEKLDWIFFQLGNIAKNRKDYPQARDYYTRVIKDYPDSYWKNRAEYQMNDLDWLQNVETRINDLKKEME
ncbi:MAG: tetratricopeptide repeat protein, partial [Candidatus Delongbacteria bacterium]|nr:tetratricopeptide repeat protein [Candidatus Delongbacteria bacterium]